jgi:hypothetical protein
MSVRKANYGPKGLPITVRWKAGAYVVEGGPSSLDRMALAQKGEETFMKLLRQFSQQGQNVTSIPCSTFAPKLFAAHSKAEGLGKAHLTVAMQELLDRGNIKIETFGPPSRQRSRLVCV